MDGLLEAVIECECSGGAFQSFVTRVSVVCFALIWSMFSFRSCQQAGDMVSAILEPDVPANAHAPTAPRRIPLPKPRKRYT